METQALAHDHFNISRELHKEPEKKNLKEYKSI